ncbi:Z1 domain-containing protein [Mucilaginibacter myungsuensis]|nr:Z1 domain-containing protein [Mucilaginibacter myungsuensis]MDN3598720.1 Z1 domain-containing protein [Mucilaginibacter myungsuensis]
MSETISILPSGDGSDMAAGPLTTALLADLGRKLSAEERETLLIETGQILSNCNPVDEIGSATGIVIGYVQSGKTMSFTTLTALAADHGYRMVIYLAGIKNNLLDQTTKRLKSDLQTEAENMKIFRVLQSPTMAEDSATLIKNTLSQRRKPVVLITVLKHYKHIGELTQIIKTPEVRDALGSQGVLIIDDEADQASLNTYARKNSKAEDWEEDEFSSTYSSILDLKAALKNHTYIQYTATPQGPLLINIMDLLSPKFHVLLTPGGGYTGGKTFFVDQPGLIVEIPRQEVYHYKLNDLEHCPQSLIEALQLFLIGVAIVVEIKQKARFLSMMVHADRETDASKKFHKWVKAILGSWADRLNDLDEGDPSRLELIAEFKSVYPEAVKLMDEPPAFDAVIEALLDVILDYRIHLVIGQGSKRSPEINWSSASAHILIGAEMLNRGYTVEGLAVSYMPRYTIGKANADTIQQRCRFFGYKRSYIQSCRVFLPEGTIEEYEDYVKHEEIMRGELSTKSLEEFEKVLVLSSSMNPTRNNILTKDIVRSKLLGWRQLNALQHIEENTRIVEEFRAAHEFTLFEDYKTSDRNHLMAKVPIDEAISFLRDFKISNVPDTLRKSSTIQYLNHMKEHTDLKYAYVFDMAYQVNQGRERSLIEKDGKLKINNIFSGASLSGSLVYPGDRYVYYPDFLCIQIHKIRLKHDSEWNRKILYTLGIYYPESLEHTFVGMP